MRILAFIYGIALASLTPSATLDAQAPQMVPRVGYVQPGRAETDVYRASFLRGMRELGYVDGENIVIEYRYADNDYAALPRLMDDIVQSKVAVIVTRGTLAIRAAQAATRTIPIVMAAVGDPVANGFVASVARPAGNITGFSLLSPELIGKRLGLFKEAIPGASRIGVLWHPENSLMEPMEQIEVAARSLGLALHVFNARGPNDFAAAFGAMAAVRVDAVLVVTEATFLDHRAQIVALGEKQKLPLICGYSELAQAGCLLTYAVSLNENFRLAATYVDKILKGARPADLPVQQPTKFELIINLRTAKALGITIPAALLAYADEVIE